MNLTFTIDPITAKDFDDAISFKELGKNGEYEIGIHIADVSHYVQPNTILDREAYDRATSVYLVDRVVPMLPEVLSNGLCSLRPKEEKYTFSAVFTLDALSKGCKRMVRKNSNIFRLPLLLMKRFRYMLDSESPHVDSQYRSLLVNRIMFLTLFLMR